MGAENADIGLGLLVAGGSFLGLISFPVQRGPGALKTICMKSKSLQFGAGPIRREEAIDALSCFLAVEDLHDVRLVFWAFGRGSAWLANARSGSVGRFGCGLDRETEDTWRAKRRARCGPGHRGRPVERADDHANAFLLGVFPQLAQSPLGFAVLEALFELDVSEAASSRFAPPALWACDPEAARRRRQNARKRAAARLRRAAAIRQRSLSRARR